MAYILYGDLRSGSAIIEALLAEVGASVDRIDISLSDEAQREDGFATVNLQRKLPVLITPAGETLTESAAITLTLAERHSEAKLMPSEQGARAQALRWMLFAATELYPVVEIIDYPERFTAAGGDTMATCERAQAVWRERLAQIENAIAGPFLLDAFCATDVYIAVITRWGVPAAYRAIHAPKIETLVTAVAARPAIAPVWKRHFGGRG